MLFAGCGKPFPTGERVTFTGKSCLCQRCVNKKDNNVDNNGGGHQPQNGSPHKHASSPEHNVNNNNNGHNGAIPATATVKNGNSGSDDRCATCNQELKDGQALLALDKQYHVW